MTERESDGAMWAELSTLKTQSAAISTDIGNIYGAIDEIRDAFVRSQENAKPNLGAMIAILLATCTFLVTVGGLALAPVYRDMAATHDTIQTNSVNILEIVAGQARIEGGIEEQRHQELVGALHK